MGLMSSKNSFDGFVQFKNTKNFILKTGRKDHLEKHNSITDKLSKIIIKKKNQKKRNCLVCKSNNTKLLFIKKNFKHVQCLKCGFVYVNPIFKKEISHTTFYNENSYTKVLQNKNNLKLDIKKFKYGLNKLNLNKKRKEILDFGCGFGDFLDQAKKKHWKVNGTELNKFCLKVLKKKRINILNVDDLKRNEKLFDAITMWTVLEHLAEPDKILKLLIKKLRKNGKFLFNFPNINSLSAKILHEKCSMFSGEQHINFFSPKTITKYLNNLGLKVIFLETIISDLGTVQNYLNYDHPYLGNFRKSELKFLSPDFIHKNLLGYTILCIAKKK